MCNKKALPKQNFSKSRWSSHAFILFFILAISPFFFLLNAQAGDITLAWDPPSTQHEGFILSYGTSSASLSNNEDVGLSTTHTVSNLNEGQAYSFAVKTYNANHTYESPYSNQVNVTVPGPDITPPDSPKSVQIVSGS